MVSNTGRGKEFQVLARCAVSRFLGAEFDMEVALPIGNPPKLHFFDLVSRDHRYVGEAKAFAWTISGNVPSAKITTLREAAQYLQALPPGTKGFIVMKEDRNPRTSESLADYFVRLNQHLLGQVAVLQLSGDGMTLQTIRRGSL
jgi:hypothetical protein